MECLQFEEKESYIVSRFQYFFNFTIHVVMIQRHKQSVNNNAKRDEKFCERIKHDPWDTFLELKPAPAAVPNTERVDAF